MAWNASLKLEKGSIGDPMILLHLAFGLLIGYLVFRLAPRKWQGE